MSNCSGASLPVKSKESRRNDHRAAMLWLALLGLVMIAGCGKPRADERYQRPDQVTDFPTLFGKNCSGCHGMDGQLGPAPPLNDPLFQAIVSDQQLTQVVKQGRQGTLMPAFAHSQGGSLTDNQIEIIVQGIREKWGGGDHDLPEDPPPYQVSQEDPAGLTKSDIAAGETLFATACANCHGEQGKGGEQAGPLADRALATLISDQCLRRLVITGRPDLGMPGYVDSGNHSSLGRPLTSSEIVDLVAYVRSLQRDQDETVEEGTDQ